MRNLAFKLTTSAILYIYGGIVVLIGVNILTESIVLEKKDYLLTGIILIVSGALIVWVRTVLETVNRFSSGGTSVDFERHFRNLNRRYNLMISLAVSMLTSLIVLLLLLC